jgi:hypothetical protein
MDNIACIEAIPMPLGGIAGNARLQVLMGISNNRMGGLIPAYPTVHPTQRPRDNIASSDVIPLLINPRSNPQMVHSPESLAV